MGVPCKTSRATRLRVWRSVRHKNSPAYILTSTL